MSGKTSRRWVTLGRTAGLIAVVTVLLWPSLAVNFRQNQMVSALFNWMHFPAGMMVCLILCRARADNSGLMASLLLLWVLECLQQFAGRSADLADALQSTAGAAAAFLGMGSREAPGPGRRAALAAGALSLLAVSLVPAAAAVGDYRRMRADFPLLAGFETRGELGRWFAQGCRMERVQRFVTQGRWAVRVTVMDGKVEYPGIFLEHMVRDWQGAGELVFDVNVPAGERMVLWVRLDDRERPQPAYAERFQKRLVLGGGWHRIRLPRREWKAASGRPLDLNRMARLGLFLEAAASGAEFYLDNVRLIPRAARARSAQKRGTT